MDNVRLVDRDYLILHTIEKWRVITGKHICHMCGFSGQRSCDRRLAKLISIDLLSRKKILYGVPSLYSLTSSGKALIEASNKQEQIRIEQLYGFEISHETISEITDCVLEELNEWQNRPLKKMYTFLFVDCMYVTIRKEYESKNYAVYTILGYDTDGEKDILGLWCKCQVKMSKNAHLKCTILGCG